MTGPAESIIGDDIQVVLQRFLTVMPVRLAVGTGNKIVFNSVLMNIDDKSGQAISIERLDREVDIQ
jgi:calcineurin-like phosphoesterase